MHATEGYKETVTSYMTLNLSWAEKESVYCNCSFSLEFALVGGCETWKVAWQPYISQKGCASSNIYESKMIVKVLK